MAVTLRSYEPHDFAALHRLDQSCFAAGISYSKTTLHYFLTIASADCVVAADGARVAGFILTEENPPLAHIITLDVAEVHRRHGVGSALLRESEKNLALRGVRSILLETAIEAVLKRYYLARLDAFEMRKILPDGTGKTAPAQEET
jgi:ribosomal protein S18 acetylase RimI-like enzyme